MASQKILVIEDDRSLIDVLQYNLTQAGYEVSTAMDGHSGYEKAVQTHPDLILLDLLMPEMDGFEFIEQLQGNRQWRSIPVIVVTAKDLDESERQCLQGRVRRVVAKGARSRDEILAELKLIINDRRRSTPDQETAP